MPRLDIGPRQLSEIQTFLAGLAPTDELALGDLVRPPREVDNRIGVRRQLGEQRLASTILLGPSAAREIGRRGPRR